jgi:hypothetical protein
LNEAEIACGCFVVACRQSAGAFEFVEAALDPVSQSVGDGVDEDWFFAIDLAGYDRCTAALINDTADVITVVAPVGDEHSGFGQIGIDQRIEPFEVRHFATAYLRPDRQSVSVGNEVDLGREATL